MKFSLKKCGIVACLTGALILAWINLRPVELVAVHQDDQLTYILVRNFPLTDRGKIAWWLDHADELKAKYAFPDPAHTGCTSSYFGISAMAIRKTHSICSALGI